MSLTINCPRCGTALRLEPTHITVSKGWARCGQCQHVFDAGQLSLPTLAPSDEEDLGPVAPTAVVSEPRAQAEPLAPAASGGSEHSDALASRHPAGAAAPHASRADVAPDPSPLVEPEAVADDTSIGDAATGQDASNHPAPGGPEHRQLDGLDGPGVDWSLMSSGPEASTLSDRDGPHPELGSWLDASPLDDGPTAPGLQDPSWSEPSAAADPSPEPLWVASTAPQVMPAARSAWSDLAASKPRPWGHWLGVLVALALVLTVLGQVAFHQRHHIAARWPQLHPVLAPVCAWLDCQLEAVERIHDLQVAHSAVVRLQNTHFQMDLEVRNDGDLTVRTPQLELSLQDAQGHTWTRRLMPLVIEGAPPVLAAHTRYAAQVNWRTSAQDASRVDAYQVRLVYPSSDPS